MELNYKMSRSCLANAQGLNPDNQEMFSLNIKV